MIDFQMIEEKERLVFCLYLIENRLYKIVYDKVLRLELEKEMIKDFNIMEELPRFEI